MLMTYYLSRCNTVLAPQSPASVPAIETILAEIRDIRSASWPAGGKGAAMTDRPPPEDPSPPPVRLVATSVGLGARVWDGFKAMATLSDSVRRLEEDRSWKQRPDARAGISPGD